MPVPSQTSGHLGGSGPLAPLATSRSLPSNVMTARVHPTRVVHPAHTPSQRVANVPRQGAPDRGATGAFRPRQLLELTRLAEAWSAGVNQAPRLNNSPRLQHVMNRCAGQWSHVRSRPLAAALVKARRRVIIGHRGGTIRFLVQPVDTQHRFQVRQERAADMPRDRIVGGVEGGIQNWLARTPGFRIGHQAGRRSGRRRRQQFSAFRVHPVSRG